MRALHIKLSFCLCFLFLLTDISIAQVGNLTEYPYGGVSNPQNLQVLTFREHTKFLSVTFHKDANFTNARFYGDASFYEVTFYIDANFTNAKFDGSADFEDATFHEEAYFLDVTFHKDANFWSVTFHKDANFSNVKFDSSADLQFATFDDYANFNNATFHNYASFRNATFDGYANFNNATFHKYASFRNATFDGYANFNNATFHNYADFWEATFEDITSFQKTVFRDVVDFRNTTFKKDIDFRQSNFDSVTVIYLEDMTFPEGKLHFYWEQFRGKDSLRIKLEDPSADSIKDEHYTRIEIIYHKLRDNFLAQGNKSSADNVIYELGWQRDEILDEFWWGLYGSLFGYGYQPWRFLLYIVTPIILLFAFILYWFYYTLLVFINPSIFPKIVDASALRTKEIHLIKIKNIRLFKLHITDFNITLENANRLTRYWHTIFFSASVLLGIRFKKDWTTVFPLNMVGRKTFIYFITLEWILGIGLFVTFALLVEGIRFSFIKDLLGF